MTIPTVESTTSGVNDVPNTYWMSPEVHERPAGAFLDGKTLCVSQERLAMWDANRDLPQLS